ncbi:TIM barrel protein [Octadecabacter sp. CECT 8868]|uniref:TIM barrel protein n=1 Tax=Octadecabacter algicola TaxID=2909342 RepID=UPI001F20699F|nr:TIM barrel protein [Octadecabacter algicola]MCF2905190.1 TIM barrel protein [Octadecabacter algicola]
MFPIGLNHQTMPHAATLATMDAAVEMGCVGIELRNDLATPLFDNNAPEVIRDAAASRALRILALAEVYGFNDNDTQSHDKVRALIDIAKNCGAEAIALIPRIQDSPVPRQVQRDQLRDTLTALLPLFENSGITGLIEPLGFPNASLRLKADVRAVLDEIHNPTCFALIHDTFHHALSGETDVFAAETKIVHISGVSDPHVKFDDMTDEMRGLVDDQDRLGNIAQIAELRAQGYDGPYSFEAFSADVHALENPVANIAESTKFITAQIAEREA